MVYKLRNEQNKSGYFFLKRPVHTVCTSYQYKGQTPYHTHSQLITSTHSKHIISTQRLHSTLIISTYTIYTNSTHNCTKAIYYIYTKSSQYVWTQCTRVRIKFTDSIHLVNIPYLHTDYTSYSYRVFTSCLHTYQGF